MDSEKTTTRKGFLKRAGLAFAGAFALSGAMRSKSKPDSKPVASTGAPRVMSRIRTAKGAVARKIV
jgi:hypothetical protein